METKQERLAQGKPVGRDVPYAAVGGLTGFSSLAEGYMRLDDSGIGKWSEVWACYVVFMCVDNSEAFCLFSTLYPSCSPSPENILLFLFFKKCLIATT